MAVTASRVKDVVASWEASSSGLTPPVARSVSPPVLASVGPTPVPTHVPALEVVSDAALSQLAMTPQDLQVPEFQPGSSQYTPHRHLDDWHRRDDEAMASDTPDFAQMMAAYPSYTSPLNAQAIGMAIQSLATASLLTGHMTHFQTLQSVLTLCAQSIPEYRYRARRTRKPPNASGHESGKQCCPRRASVSPHLSPSPSTVALGPQGDASPSPPPTSTGRCGTPPPPTALPLHPIHWPPRKLLIH